MYCLEVMASSRPGTVDVGQREKSDAAVGRPYPHAPFLESPTRGRQDETVRDEGNVTIASLASTSPRRRTQPADLERILILAFLLYGLTCFYAPEAKRWNMFVSAEQELTALLLNISASILIGHLTEGEAHRTQRDDDDPGEKSVIDILVWCVYVAAEGWRLVDDNGHQRLHPKGVDLLTVLNDYLDHRLPLSLAQSPHSQSQAGTFDPGRWEHLNTILRGGLYCGQRAMEWRLCWEEFQEQHSAARLSEQSMQVTGSLQQRPT